MRGIASVFQLTGGKGRPNEFSSGLGQVLKQILPVVYLSVRPCKGRPTFLPLFLGPAQLVMAQHLLLNANMVMCF